jgi:hypothetical protein
MKLSFKSLAFVILSMVLVVSLPLDTAYAKGKAKNNKNRNSRNCKNNRNRNCKKKKVVGHTGISNELGENRSDVILIGKQEAGKKDLKALHNKAF